MLCVRVYPVVLLPHLTVGFRNFQYWSVFSLPLTLSFSPPPLQFSCSFSVSIHLSVSFSLICPLFLHFHRQFASFLRSKHDGWVKLTATSCFKTSSARVCLIKLAQKTFISHYISLRQSCCLFCSPCYRLKIHSMKTAVLAPPDLLHPHWLTGLRILH